VAQGRTNHDYVADRLNASPWLTVPPALGPEDRAPDSIQFNLTGFESHAGSTPMPRRKDALLGAARIVELVNRIGLAHAPNAVSTVGMLNPYPNSRNVIPGSVFMTVDFRHPEDGTLSAMDAALQEGVKAITDGIGLEC
jgi:N-carbamoyl-L-amino-acid hydrolase